MLNTKIGSMYNNNTVVNSNDLRKRLINVDSKFRSNITDNICNFQYRLEHKYKNIIRMRVASVEIPNTFYTFSNQRQNISFKVSTQDYAGINQLLVVTIDDGNYTSADLIDEIQNQFNVFRDNTGIYLTIELNVNSGKIGC
jgi:hypothetical protein